MKARVWISIAVVFYIFTAFPLIVAAAVATKPNVLFIVVDDLRPELGCYGKDYIKSPNIDALAKAGMVFKRAYCQQAVCSPSRSSVMTGTRPDTTQVWDLETHFRKALPNVVTLGQHFKQQGYFVQGMGKIYHGGLNDPPTWSMPWGTPKSMVYALPENRAASRGEVQGEPDAQDPQQAKPGQPIAPGVRGPAFESADVPDNTYQDGKVADLAVETLDKLSKKPEPFFLAVGFIKPHLPWVSPKKYWDMYDPKKIELAPNPFVPKGAPNYAIAVNDGEIRTYRNIPKTGPFSDELARQLKHAYFAGVSYTDAQVGKVIAELDRLGLRTNTIIVLWGDHGWKLGEHAAWGKHSNVENDVNAPLIFSSPGMKARGTQTDALVEFVDIYPTLCELAELPLPGHLEGMSLKPLLDDPRRPWKTAAFSQYPRPAKGGLMGYTMRTDRYRFTAWVSRKDHSKIDAIELYDHQTDPQENTNIVLEPAHAELVAGLTEQWRKGWQGAKPPGLPEAKNTR